MGNTTSCPHEVMPTDPYVSSTSLLSCFKLYTEVKRSYREPFISGSDINFTAHHVGWIIAGFFGLIGSAASVWLIKKHLEFYTKPTQQRYIVRILFMVPCYAAYSWFSYYWWKHAIYFQLIRDCYEAVVIASFFYLLLYYLGDTDEELAEVFRQVKFDHWIWAFGRWRYKPSGPYFLVIMKWSIGQYWIFRPGCTAVAVVTQAFNLYCLASWSPQYSHVWTSVLISISVTIAMYAVLQFYVTMKQELREYSPMLKFFAVKAVVFLTFWQESALAVLAMAGVIKPTTYWSAHEIQVGISAILSCFEMAIFGFLHIKCFTYLPYRPISSDPAKRAFQKTSKWAAFKDVCDLRDVLRDLWIGTKQVSRKVVGKQIEKPLPDRHLEHALGRSRILDKSVEKRTTTKNKEKTEVEKELERIKLGAEMEEKEQLLSDERLPEISLPWANTATAFSPSVNSPMSFNNGKGQASFGDVRPFPKSSTGVLFPLPSPHLDDYHARIRTPVQDEHDQVVHSRPSGWFKRNILRSGSRGGAHHTPVPTSDVDSNVNEILADRSLPYDHRPSANYHVARMRPRQGRRVSGPTPPRNGVKMPDALSPSRYPGFDEQAYVDRMYALHAVAESVTASPRNSGPSSAPMSRPSSSSRSSYFGPMQYQQGGWSARPSTSENRRISAHFVQPPSVTALPPAADIGASALALPRHNLPAASVHSLPSTSSGSLHPANHLPYQSSRGRSATSSEMRRQSFPVQPRQMERANGPRRYSIDQPMGLGLSFNPNTHGTAPSPALAAAARHQQPQAVQQRFVFDEY